MKAPSKTGRACRGAVAAGLVLIALHPAFGSPSADANDARGRVVRIVAGVEVVAFAPVQLAPASSLQRAKAAPRHSVQIQPCRMAGPETAPGRQCVAVHFE